MEHVNGLSLAEAERLAKLISDLGEVQKIVGDVLVHGYDYVPAPDFCPIAPSLPKRLETSSVHWGW